MSTVVEIAGGGFDSLVRAAEEVRRGGRVEYLEPGLRAGGAMVTESFLSPFRFNLGPALVPRPPLPTLHVLEPDPVLAVGDALLRRNDPDRSLLAALALLQGVDPRSEERVHAVAQSLRDLVLVSGGNGVAASYLVDEIVAAGSSVRELGAVEGPRDAQEGLGICRLFVGLRGPAPRTRALATAYGFRDDASLRARLEALRAGDVDVPLGFLVSNDHLDANLVEPGLASFVWQGILPFDIPVVRHAYVDAVLQVLGVDPGEIVFQLLWLPADTGEALV